MDPPITPLLAPLHLTRPHIPDSSITLRIMHLQAALLRADTKRRLDIRPILALLGRLQVAMPAHPDHLPVDMQARQALPPCPLGRMVAQLRQ